jgi:hypothetical protein
MGDPTVISEQELANLHSEFWRQLLPMCENYVRSRNRQLGRFAPPLASKLPAHSRGTINEFGFRLFAASEILDSDIDDLPADIVAHSYLEAMTYIYGPKASIENGSDAQSIQEAKSLAKRLRLFFQKANARPLTVFPAFNGCGVVDECVGDVIGGDSLFEVKAGGRNFRGIDIRQVLVYCALNYASPVHSISRVCLVNPRGGVFLEESLEDLARDASGRSSADVLSELIEFISEPTGQYGAQ